MAFVQTDNTVQKGKQGLNKGNGVIDFPHLFCSIDQNAPLLPLSEKHSVPPPPLTTSRILSGLLLHQPSAVEISISRWHRSPSDRHV
jgi:hypothetical protein